MKPWYVRKEKFVEMLQAEFESKAKKMTEALERLQETEIEYRFVYDGDDDHTPQVLLDEDYFGEDMSLTLEYRGGQYELILERRNSKYEVVKVLKMRNEDLQTTVNYIDALILVNKAGFNEGLNAEELD